MTLVNSWCSCLHLIVRYFLSETIFYWCFYPWLIVVETVFCGCFLLGTCCCCLDCVLCSLEKCVLLCHWAIPEKKNKDEGDKFTWNFQVFYFTFLHFHSTIHTLIGITESTRKSCDNGLYSCGVFLDLTKAFDTVNHKILLSKLEHYGIRGKVKEWFSSFIYNRQQCTSIDGQNSELNKISHGVPKSSVLGPLLFIFINDLHYAAKHSKVQHFADDTRVRFNFTKMICEFSKQK